jgi:hypothetical protein
MEGFARASRKPIGGDELGRAMMMWIITHMKNR